MRIKDLKYDPTYVEMDKAKCTNLFQCVPSYILSTGSNWEGRNLEIHVTIQVTVSWFTLKYLSWKLLFVKCSVSVFSCVLVVYSTCIIQSKRNCSKVFLQERWLYDSLDNTTLGCLGRKWRAVCIKMYWGLSDYDEVPQQLHYAVCKSAGRLWRWYMANEFQFQKIFAVLLNLL